MKNKDCIILIVGLLFGVNLGAGSFVRAQRAEDTVGFVAKSYPTVGYPMLYREARTGAANPGELNSGSNPSQKPALVIFLHGSSARGYDNFKHMRTWGIRTIYNYLNENNMNAFFLVPQCPRDRHWDEWKKIHNFYMTDYLRDLIQVYVDKEGVDPGRVYAFGVSMGGGGVWRLLNDYPGLLAAAMPAVATPRKIKAGRAVKTPVCSVVGEKDEVVKMDQVQALVNAIGKKGGEVKFEIMPGKDHREACRDAFSEERIAWVLNHTNKRLQRLPSRVVR